MFKFKNLKQIHKILIALAWPFLLTIGYIMFIMYNDANWADKYEWPIGLVFWGLLTALLHFVSRPKMGGTFWQFVAFYLFSFGVVVIQIATNGH